MAVRLFSKDPMSWGQIFFLWLGGLLVVGVTVFAGTGVAYLSDAAQGRADRLETQANRLAAGLPESIFEWEQGRITELIPLPEPDPVAPPPSEEDSARAEELLEELAESLRRSADSLGLSSLDEFPFLYRREEAEEVMLRLQEAQPERRGARLWFGGAMAVFLVAAGGVGFLVWRSFHGAARA